jgi:hypothetical protein
MQKNSPFREKKLFMAKMSKNRHLAMKSERCCDISHKYKLVCWHGIQPQSITMRSYAYEARPASFPKGAMRTAPEPMTPKRTGANEGPSG